MIHAQKSITKAMASPVAVTAGMTNVSFIDTMGADYAKIDVNVSDIATTGVATATGGSISIGEADDTNVSNATTVIANVTGLKFARCRTYLVDTKTRKRYLHCTFTAGSAGVSNETQLLSVTGAVSRLGQGPTSVGGMVSGLTNSAAAIVVS